MGEVGLLTISYHSCIKSNFSRYSRRRLLQTTSARSPCPYYPVVRFNRKLSLCFKLFKLNSVLRQFLHNMQLSALSGMYCITDMKAIRYACRYSAELCYTLSRLCLKNNIIICVIFIIT